MRTLKGTRAGFVQQIVRGAAAVRRRFAEVRRPSDSVLMKELGIPGGPVEKGLTRPSYHPELEGPAWYRTVDEMLLSSSQAAVVELCLTLPIVSARWTLEGGDAALRELCEVSLFGAGGMSTHWDEVLYNDVSCALYGLAFDEVVWGEVGIAGALGIRRIVNRDPASLVAEEGSAFVCGPDGGLRSVVQSGVDPETEEEVERSIPIEKCLLFPYRMRRRDYHGRSILRPAYRHFESIRMLCGFADIGLDHSLTGVPVGKAPAGAKEKDLEKFRALLAAIRRHESSGLVMPYGWDLVNGVALGGGDQVGFLDYIQWHEGCFLRSALCSFMQLGSTPTGTTELGSALMGFGLMAWSSLAEMVRGIYNRHLIRRVCDYNAGGKELPEEAYPELVVSPIRESFEDAREATGYLAAVATGEEALPEEAGARAAAVRSGLGLREGDDRAEGAPPRQPAGAMPPRQPAGAMPPRQPAGAMPEGRRFAEVGRGVRSEAEVAAAVARVGADQEAALDGWGAATLPVIRRLLAELLGRLPGGEVLEAAEIAAVRAEEATVSQLAGRIGEWLHQAYEAAWSRAEMERGVPAMPDPTAAQALRARARVIAEDLAAVAEREVRLAALGGEDAAAIAARYEEAFGTRLAGSLQAAGREVAAVVDGA